MTINTQELLAVIGGGVSLTTAIWYAAMYVGRLSVRLERHEDRLDEHDKAIDRLEVAAR
jgi:hypothetical protein